MFLRIFNFFIFLIFPYWPPRGPAGPPGTPRFTVFFLGAPGRGWPPICQHRAGLAVRKGRFQGWPAEDLPSQAPATTKKEKTGLPSADWNKGVLRGETGPNGKGPWGGKTGGRGELQGPGRERGGHGKEFRQRRGPGARFPREAKKQTGGGPKGLNPGGKAGGGNPEIPPLNTKIWLKKSGKKGKRGEKGGLGKPRSRFWVRGRGPGENTIKGGKIVGFPPPRGRAGSPKPKGGHGPKKKGRGNFFQPQEEKGKTFRVFFIKPFFFVFFFSIKVKFH